MSSTLGVLIRDGISSDIPACLALDHTYESEYVWQMRVHEDGDQRQIIFQTERLPRILETTWPPDENRLMLALPPEQCFLVVENRETHDLLGYLTMRHEPVYQTAVLHDLVISEPYRRRGIATRLLGIARHWAKHRQLVRLTAPLQTQNYPGILFCQHAGLTFCGYNDHYFPNRDIAVFFTESLR
jgi:GNAT superfamily N-acetyltransferase